MLSIVNLPATGETYPDATKRLLQLFNRGMLVVNYTGHGSTSAWAAENLLTMADITKMTSPRLPLWITATCDFTRFDDIQTSAGEQAFLNTKGWCYSFTHYIAGWCMLRKTPR